MPSQVKMVGILLDDLDKDLMRDFKAQGDRFVLPMNSKAKVVIEGRIVEDFDARSGQQPEFVKMAQKFWTAGSDTLEGSGLTGAQLVEGRINRHWQGQVTGWNRLAVWIAHRATQR